MVVKVPLYFITLNFLNVILLHFIEKNIVERAVDWESEDPFE